jgi:hypothetical protein
VKVPTPSTTSTLVENVLWRSNRSTVAVAGAPVATVSPTVTVTSSPKLGFEELIDRARVPSARSTNTSVEPMTPLNAASPGYEAKIVWVPAPSNVVVSVATPSGPTTPVPSTVAPSVKEIEPVGVPLPGATAPVAAEMVKVWPCWPEPGLTLTTTEGVARPTTWVTAAEVAASRSAVPR